MGICQWGPIEEPLLLKHALRVPQPHPIHDFNENPPKKTHCFHIVSIHVTICIAPALYYLKKSLIQHTFRLLMIVSAYSTRNTLVAVRPHHDQNRSPDRSARPTVRAPRGWSLVDIRDLQY